MMEHVEGVVAICAGAVALGRFLYVKAVRPMARMVRSNYAALQGIPNIAAEVHAVRQELMPNGGKSLRDTIDQMASRQALDSSLMELICTEKNIPHFVVNNDGEVVLANSVMCELLNREEHELLNRNLAACVALTHRRNFEEEWNDAVETQRNMQFIAPFLMPDGSTREINIRMQPVHYRDRLVSYRGTVSEKR